MRAIIATGLLLVALATAAPLRAQDATPQHSGIIQPKVIHSVDAPFTEYAREHHIHGTCLVALIVDVDGNPRDVHIVRSLEPSLDASAVDAVRQYKFRPATREGQPIAVPMSVSVEFFRF